MDRIVYLRNKCLSILEDKRQEIKQDFLSFLEKYREYNTNEIT